MTPCSCYSLPVKCNGGHEDYYYVVVAATAAANDDNDYDDYGDGDVRTVMDGGRTAMDEVMHSSVVEYN